MSTSRRVILISGYPDQGKSFLGEALRNQHGFHLIQIDGIYVQFIRNACLAVNFPAVSQFIYQHYNQIFVNVQGGITAWHKHLFDEIIQASEKHRDLAVEGYLLKDCKDQFEIDLKEQGRQVFQIRMQGRVATLESPRLTAGEVADLGKAAPRKKRR
jgi:hypothetical protein